jgi:hypothetical protein
LELFNRRGTPLRDACPKKFHIQKKTLLCKRASFSSHAWTQGHNTLISFSRKPNAKLLSYRNWFQNTTTFDSSHDPFPGRMPRRFPNGKHPSQAETSFREDERLFLEFAAIAIAMYFCGPYFRNVMSLIPNGDKGEVSLLTQSAPEPTNTFSIAGRS